MDDNRGRAANLLDRHLSNPFRVLDLPADAPQEVVERTGELLISMLAVGMPEAARFTTPFGPAERTPEMVREALAELRNPDRRLIHEWWLERETS